jgi:hypothetical protein
MIINGGWYNQFSHPIRPTVVSVRQRDNRTTQQLAELLARVNETANCFANQYQPVVLHNRVLTETLTITQSSKHFLPCKVTRGNANECNVNQQQQREVGHVMGIISFNFAEFY